MAKTKTTEERKPITFVLSDESVNIYGFRLRTEGIDISRYQLNPVVLYMHLNGVFTVVGRGVNIRKEEGKLLCDVEFDYDDEDAARVAGKVERGFVRAASVGFDPKKVANSETKDGKTETWVEESELLEWSIVGIGANRHAIRLLDAAGKLVELNSATSVQLSASLAPPLLPPSDTNQTERKMDLKAMAKQLGLAETATEEQVQAALTAKLSQASQAEGLQSQLKAEREAKVKGLLDAAIASKAILPGERKDFEDLAETNLAMFEKTLALRKPVPNLVEVAKGGQANPASPTNETPDQLKAEWNRLHRVGGLAELKAGNPDRYNQLYAARYGEVKAVAGKTPPADAE